MFTNPDEGSLIQDLVPTVDDYKRVVEPENYQPLPDDWNLYATDVINSTKAIHNNQYRSVNQLWGATITSIRSVFEQEQTLSSFGGDGGVVATPPV